MPNNEIFVFRQIWELICRAGGHVWTWLVAVLSFFVSLIAPEWYCFAVVGTAIFLDAIFGIAVAHKKRIFALSRLLRITVMKVASYGTCLLVVLMIERLAHESGFIGVKLAAAWAAACEFWSISASILIIWPEAVFIRLLRKQLKGEIEHKLGKNCDDIFPEQ